MQGKPSVLLHQLIFLGHLENVVVGHRVTALPLAVRYLPGKEEGKVTSNHPEGHWEPTYRSTIFATNMNPPWDQPFQHPPQITAISPIPA